MVHFISKHQIDREVSECAVRPRPSVRVGRIVFAADMLQGAQKLSKLIVSCSRGRKSLIRTALTFYHSQMAAQCTGFSVLEAFELGHLQPVKMILSFVTLPTFSLSYWGVNSYHPRERKHENKIS